MQAVKVPEELLDVHHIDSNRSHNDINNLAVLCVWCHAIVTRFGSLAQLGERDTCNVEAEGS